MQLLFDFHMYLSNCSYYVRSAYHFSLFMAGNKVNNVDVVYTPWSNLKKTASMDVGQVGFHNSKMVNVFHS